MEKLKIIDSFLMEKDIQFIRYYLTNNFKTKCLERNNAAIVGDYAYWIVSLNTNSFFNNYLKDIIEQNFNKKFYLKNVYAIGQTYSQTSTYHKDNCNIDNNIYTVCLYLNDNTEIDYDNIDGSIFFKDPFEQYIISVLPKHNRGILFPANYLHKGDCFNKYSTALRICVTWKLQEVTQYA
jgi:hypothetical protein